MSRKKNPASEMNVAEKQSLPLAQRLSTLITDVSALKDCLGVSAQAINQYKLGVSRPSLENLCKIADFYGVSTDYLLGLTDTKSNDTTIRAVCDYTGLSEEAIKSIVFDHNQKRRGDLFEVLDFLISESYVSFWANLVKNCVRNIAEIQTIGPKIGTDFVEDNTRFYMWKAMRGFEKSLDEAVKIFSVQYSTNHPVDPKSYLAKQKKEMTEKLARIQKMEEQAEVKPNAINQEKGNEGR